MLKYLTRAMSALTPRSAYQRELEGRRAYTRQEQAGIKAHREKVRAALERGDKHEALRLAQPGAADTQTGNERRLAELCAEDDLLFAKVEREHAESVANFAAIQSAQEDALARRRYVFANAADEAKFVRLFNDKTKHGDAIAMLRRLLAEGLVIEAELPR